MRAIDSQYSVSFSEAPLPINAFVGQLKDWSAILWQSVGLRYIPIPLRCRFSVPFVSGKASGWPLNAEICASVFRSGRCMANRNRQPIEYRTPAITPTTERFDATEKLFGTLCKIHRQLRKRWDVSKNRDTSSTHFRFPALLEASAMFAKTRLEKADFALEGCSAFGVFDHCARRLPSTPHRQTEAVWHTPSAC